MAIDQDAMKRMAAAKALEYLTDGMKLGLGTKAQRLAAHRRQHLDAARRSP